MTDDREAAERRLRLVRRLLEHSTLYVMTTTVVMFVAFMLAAGSVQFAGILAIVTGVGLWYTWRPGGPISRSWADRIAEADASGDESDPDSDGTVEPPAGP